MAITADTHMTLKKSLQDPDRSAAAPRVAESSIQLHSALKGFLPIDAPTDPSSSLPLDVNMQPASNHNPLISAVPVLPSSSSPSSSLAESPGNPPESHLPGSAQLLSRKRAAEASTHAQPTKRQRQPRSCRKCANGTECPGRKEVIFCKSQCKDCGKIKCRGRNPKKLRLPCSEGWE